MFMKKIIVASIIFVFVLAVGGMWMSWVNLISQPASTEHTEVVFEVEPGQSFSTVIRTLERKGLIKGAELIILYAKVKSSIAQIRVGEYLISPDMKPMDIIDILRSGKSIERKITVSEGLSTFDIVSILSSAGFGTPEVINAQLSNPEFIKEMLGEPHESLEGYLFPETYSYTKYTTLKTMLTMMVHNSMEKWKAVEARATELGFSRNQVFTLASIIEKETGAASERPLISSVFHNRLKKNMLLQTDPTIIYAKALTNHSMEISITKADLTFDHPYNTYVHKGLPPGPIANPGFESLKAAVNPDVSDFLFFVSRNDGTHVFSKDFNAHKKAVASFQLDPKAREGKSWRDLKAKNGDHPVK